MFGVSQLDISLARRRHRCSRLEAVRSDCICGKLTRVLSCFVLFFEEARKATGGGGGGDEEEEEKRGKNLAIHLSLFVKTITVSWYLLLTSPPPPPPPPPVSTRVRKDQGFAYVHKDALCNVKEFFSSSSCRVSLTWLVLAFSTISPLRLLQTTIDVA